MTDVESFMLASLFVKHSCINCCNELKFLRFINAMHENY